MVTTKKPKLDPLDWKSWGVEKYGYSILLNPKYVQFHGCIVLDVENYKNGNFAGIGIMTPHANTVIYYSDHYMMHNSAFKLSTLIGHVLRTDINKLIKWGFDIDVNKVHYDTALIEHLQNSTKRKYGLKDLAKEKFGMEWPTYEQMCKASQTGDLDGLPIESVANYNGCDLIATYKLWQSQQ